MCREEEVINILRQLILEDFNKNIIGRAKQLLQEIDDEERQLEFYRNPYGDSNERI